MNALARPRTLASRLLCASLLVIVTISCTKPPPVMEKAELVRRGDDLVEKKQYAEAAAAYRQAVAIDTADGPTQLKLANAYVSEANWGEAALAAIRAADLLPDSIDAQLLAAALLLPQGQFREAADHSSAVLRQQPENVAALVLFANAKAHFQNSTQALSKLDETVREGGDYKPLPSQVRDIVLKADDDDAEAALLKAARIAPDNADALSSLANFLWATGRTDEGLPPLKRWADASSDGLPKRILGRFYLSRGRQSEAEAYLKAAAAMGDRTATFDLADYYSAHQRNDEALTILGHADEKDESTGAVALRRAALEFRVGKRADAMRRVDAVFTAERTNTRALLLKAGFLSEVGNWKQAVRVARVAGAQDPKSSEARIVLGRALFATGDSENALAEFSEARRLDPKSSQASIELTRISLALGRYQPAVDYARDGLLKDPDDRELALALVKSLMGLRDYAGADTALAPLLSRFPSSPDVLAELGDLQSARGNNGAARSAFTRALEADSDSLTALSGLTALDLKEQRTAAARQRITDVVARHQRDPDYLLVAASVYSADRDIPNAESMFKRALAIDPGNARGALAFADFLEREHRPDQAKDALAQLLIRRPDSIDGHTALGLLLERLGRRAEAQAEYEKIAAPNQPAAATATYRLASIYLEQGKLDAALNLAVEAKKSQSDDPAVSDLIGWVYVQKNFPTLGIPRLQEAVRRAPGVAVYHFHLGAAYARAEQSASAREELTRALQLDPNLDQARQELASLRR